MLMACPDVLPSSVYYLCAVGWVLVGSWWRCVFSLPCLVGLCPFGLLPACSLRLCPVFPCCPGCFSQIFALCGVSSCVCPMSQQEQSRNASHPWTLVVSPGSHLHLTPNQILLQPLKQEFSLKKQLLKFTSANLPQVVSHFNSQVMSLFPPWPCRS